MKRLVILTAGVAFLLSISTGCTSDGEFSMRKSLGWDDAKARASMPQAKNLPPAPIEIAERVELVGRKVIAQNTFTGIEPLFFAVGMPESVLFHVGTEQLFISEGLVKKCTSDAELAAVLCAELGKMVAEKRNAKAVGRDVDPIPDTSHGAGPLFPGGTAFDAGRQVDLAYHEKQFPRGAKNTSDPNETARELLKGAGYSPAELDRVEPLLKQSDRGEQLRKQMGGSGPRPEWK